MCSILFGDEPLESFKVMLTLRNEGGTLVPSSDSIPEGLGLTPSGAVEVYSEADALSEKCSVRGEKPHDNLGTATWIGAQHTDCCTTT